SLSPRHQHLPQKRKVLPMSPVQNVTYLSGRALDFQGFLAFSAFLLHKLYIEVPAKGCLT
ncbi:hypothetical protein, partial [Rhizobium mesoamericanum]|uniref:hypothetical protein n=1 Tax=Rhizobium mesoamericanum TaxID=1079800 RepID=UPI0027D77018